MFLFIIQISVYYSPGGKFFTPFFVMKLVINPRFSNALSETLRTYTFLVMVFIVSEIMSIMLKAWKIKSRCVTRNVLGQGSFLGIRAPS